MSSDRLSNSPLLTNVSKSWSSLRLHRRAIRSSSGGRRDGRFGTEASVLVSGVLSNTAERGYAIFCYLNSFPTLWRELNVCVEHSLF